MNNNKKNIDNRHLLNFVLILSGGSVAILGILVILGWHIQNMKLIQVFPHFVPMQYNTAIGFLLCGIGLILRVYNLLRLSVICGATVVTLGLLTLVQYIFNLNIGIDQLFVNHYITVETSHPGRMAPNTALCFVLSGTYLLITNLLFNQKYQSIITIFISTTISAFGIVAFFGYLFGIEPAYGWSYFTSMAVHTALGFIILSSGLIVYTWKSSLLEKQARFRWVPVFIGIGFMVVTLLIWQALEQQEQEYISRSNELRAKSLKNQTEEILESRISSLKRMAQRWEIRGRTPKEEWESDATNYVNNHPVYQAIEWVDTSFHVRWIVPLKGNEEAQNLNLAFEEHRRIALEQARDLRKVTATSSIDLVQGGKGFLVYVPLYLKEGFDGFILGVFRIQKLFDLVLSTSNLHGYSLTVFGGEDEIYRKNVQKNPNMHKWGFVTDIKCCEVSFRVLTWPSPELLAQTQSFVPEVTLGFGLFFSFLFSLTIYFYQTSRLRTKQVELSNQEMHKEIITRKKMEDELIDSNTKLQESEKRFRIIFEKAGLGIMLLERNRPIISNPAFIRMLGYTERELHNMNVEDITHPDDIAKELLLTDDLLSGKIDVFQIEKRYIRKDGKVIFGNLIVSQGKDDKFGVAIIKDITERKQIEEDLLESRNKFKNLAQVSPSMIFQADLHGNNTYVNKRWSEITGMSESSSLGHGWENALHPDDRDKTICSWMEAVRNKSTWQYEFRFKQLEGTAIWVLARAIPIKSKEGKHIGFIGTCTDITDIKKAEEEIKQLNESLEQRVVKRTEELAKSNEELNKLSNAVQQSHNAVLITDFKGNIEYANPSFTQLTGYTLKEVIGENPRILKSSKTPPEEYKRLWENITSGKEWQREICNKKKNGELYWETVSISPVKNTEGVITHFIKIAENITERKRSEKQLLNYQSQLKRLASMLSLTEERERRHISEDLHDRIGQTLAFIKMKLEELRESGVTTNVIFALRKIQYHLDTTIRETRSLIAEISPPVLYELGFELAVKRLIEEFREKHNIVFNFVNDKLNKPVNKDMGSILFKSVRELLFNVTKHAKAHRVKVSILRKGDNIRIDVEDDGVGFDYSKDYFLENKDSGFGLFNIRERLEYVGGCLEVRSKPDHGTQVTLVAPLECKEEVKDAK
jgi:PAS domain S-box-containing protein